MAQVTFEFRFDSDPSTNAEDVQNTITLLKEWIEKKIFQQEVNAGMQNELNLNIQLLSINEDTADFEVVDGWAEPCLRYSVLK